MRSDHRLQLETAQAGDREYRRQREQQLRDVRRRTGVTLGLIYGALLVAVFTAFGRIVNAQDDRLGRGVLGLGMYLVGIATVPVTVGFARLYDRIWTYHARRLGLEPIHANAEPADELDVPLK